MPSSAHGRSRNQSTAGDSGIIWFAQQCLINNAPLERHIKRAERAGDRELANFLRRALQTSLELHRA